MKKLLVVSENVELCTFLNNTMEEKNLRNHWRVDYCYTSFNDAPHAMREFGAAEINVKDPSIVAKIIKDYDMVFSLHCKQIFPEELVTNIKCFNFHPGLNPFNRGWYPQVFSILNKLPIGATIHAMDVDVDHGDIVAQKPVDIFCDDTSLDVYNRVIEAEKSLLVDNLENILAGNVTVRSPSGEGNYNSVEDFRDLCALDLHQTDTLENHIDLLRALTHGKFKNGYFLKDGKRIYISVQFEKAEI